MYGEWQDGGMFGDGGVPSPRQTAEWVVRSAAVLSGCLVRRPEVDAATSRLSGVSPAFDRYRWIHVLLKDHGLLCDPTTVWRVMRRRGWLATGRLQRVIEATARGAGAGALHHFLDL
jgi:hypothetical protein